MIMLIWCTEFPSKHIPSGAFLECGERSDAQTEIKQTKKVAIIIYKNFYSAVSNLGTFLRFVVTL